MSHKRILLLHQDLLLTDLLCEKLEAAGMAVEAQRSGEAGLRVAAQRRPDAVVLDPVLPGMELTELIKGLRAAGGGARPTPVIVLPTSRPVLAEAAQQAGADVVLPRGGHGLADLIDAVQTKLGLEKGSPLVRNLASRPDESWVKKSMNAAPETLTALRRTLHETIREGGAATAMTDFYHRMHGFAEQMALLGPRPLHYLAAQIEALAHDLSKYPEQMNSSVLRTLGQALDFLVTLLPDALRGRLRDPSSAQVLVVDDEDGARKIVMAAMRLANLKSMAADTPSTGLSALGVQGFDLIFLDVGLPEMNGFELCTKIRALPLHEKTPIIFITGMATFQNRVQSSLSGGNDFVGKPFSLPELGLKALIWIFKGQLGQT